MRYRDKNTGHFVSKSTWKRSKSHGGSRFVRESTKSKTHRPSGGGRTKATPPNKITTAEQYDQAYDDFDDYIDDGELGSGIDYGEEE